MRTANSSVRLLLAALASSALGCGNPPVVVPFGGAPEASAATAGVSLTIHAAEWNGDPDDLGDYVTPVLVDIYNGGQQEVRISYFDFALHDESGLRYAALNPFSTAARGELERPAPGARLAVAREDEMPPGVLVAGRFISPPPARGGYRGGSFRVGGGVRIGGGYGGAPASHYYGGRGFYSGSRVYTNSPRFSGYLPYAHYRTYFGAGFGGGYWGGSLIYPPGYATWVWPWTSNYYPSPSPPTDVIEAGLPEGVLQPGGHVEGFLYFQHVRPNAHVLTFVFDAVDAQQNTSMGQARVSLEVRR